MEYDKILQGFGLLFEYQAARITNIKRLLKLADELQDFIRNSPYRPAYNGCLLDIIGGIREPLTSQVIANIFRYKDENNRYVLLESFISNFISTDIIVKHPRIEAEKEHLDISIKDKDYAIVIENKLKNAPFQRNQLARYIGILKEDYTYNENNIYVVIMPQFYDTEIRMSVGRLPLDWRDEHNEFRKCAQNKHECWCDFPNIELNEEQLKWCSKCDTQLLNRLKDNTVKLHNDYADWLIEESEKLHSNQWPLKTCMQQFAYYLKGLYYTRYSNKLNMAIAEFLRDKIITKGSSEENWQTINETVSELDELKNAILGLRSQVATSFVKEWETALKKDYPRINSDSKSFGLLINGIWIGCWSGIDDNNNQPYWGFYSNEKPGESQIEMVKVILSDIGISKEVKEISGYMVWDNTLDGADICRRFYESAIHRGYFTTDL